MAQTECNHIDNQRFLSLLREAIGEKTQAAFAKETGISKYTLNRYLTNGLTAVPRLSTLQKIADASDGKVAFADLLYSAGLYKEAEKAASGHTEVKAPVRTITEEEVLCRKEASELAENMKEYVSTAIKSPDISSVLDTFNMLYGTGYDLSSGSECPYTQQELGGNRLGSEFYIPVTATWTKSHDTANGGRIWSKYVLVFSLFYCRTTGSDQVAPGIILRDCAFDMQTLSSLGMQEIGTALDQISDEDENANLANYPICFSRIPCEQ